MSWYGNTNKPSTKMSSTTWDESQFWQCKGCDFSNWVHAKSCYRCKGKKLYTQAVATGRSSHGQESWQGRKPGPHHPYQSQQQTTPSEMKLNDLHELLRKAAVSIPSLPRAPPSGLSLGEGVKQHDPDKVDKQDIHKQIKDIDNALNHIPEFMPTMKEELTKKKEELKAQLTSAKPLATRIEGCKGALTRGRNRLDTAMRAKALCDQAVMEAQQFVTTKEGELQALEQELLTPQGGADKTCLDKMRVAMEQTVTAMQTGGAVPPESVAECQTLMTRLFDGLMAISSQCQQQQQLQQQQLRLQQAQQLPMVLPVPGGFSDMEEDSPSAMPLDMGPINATSMNAEGILNMLGALPRQTLQPTVAPIGTGVTA